MGGNEIVEICERDALKPTARLFGTSKEQLGKFDDYEGCANLVYQFTRDDQPRILRISYRSNISTNPIRKFRRGCGIKSIASKMTSRILVSSMRCFRQRDRLSCRLLAEKRNLL